MENFLDRLQNSNVPGRMFLFFLTMHAGVLAFDDNTMIGKVFNGAEYVGSIAIVVALIGMIDTFINDVLPDKYHFELALSVRHLTLMMSACFFATAAFLGTQLAVAYLTIPYFLACCLVISLHAFFDVRRRLRARA